jgi:2-phosphoglycerate kinase
MPKTPQPDSKRPGTKTMVEQGSALRPFMRGIMVHSLMSRGLSFDEAYRVASQVRDKVRNRAVVARSELSDLIAAVIDTSELENPPERAREIVVTSGDKGTPFSKGFLSQSMLAAALDPAEAFELAREIEEELLRLGLESVERGELRRITFEKIREQAGPRKADRYRVWRRYQEPERPVILLLGGTAGAGKTSLAQEVAHRLGVPGVMSTDQIREVMRIMLSQELVPAIHASSYDAWRVLPDLAETEDPVVSGFRTMASTVSVGVQAMIERAITENTSLILDGVSLVPGLLDLAPYKGRAHIVFLIVAALDAEAFAHRFEARARSAAERDVHRYVENMGAILAVQEYLLEMAELHDVPIVHNESFDRSVLSIIRHVTESLRVDGGFDASELL